MSSIIDRLGRLARAQLNSLQNRFRESERDDVDLDDEDLPNLDDDEPARDRGRRRRPEDAWAEPGPARRRPAWPPEVREAYAALELPLGSDKDAVKKAYRDMMRRYHPDKHHGDSQRQSTANELTRRLREAYELLNKHLSARG